MKKKLTHIAKFLFFFSISGFLFYMVYREQDTTKLLHTLKNDVNYYWILLSLFFGLLSHISRTIRWNILIESLGKRPRTINTFLAVMVGYFANLALPRMGEISRCGIITRYENISFTKLVGTVVLERALDIIMLLIFLLVALTTQFDIFSSFLDKNPRISENLSNVFTSGTSLMVITFLIAIAWIFRKKFQHTGIYKRISTTFHNFMDGFRAIKNLNNKLPFILHTVFIWIMYYLMTYVCFFSFGFTSNLPALAGLTVFVMGSFGMVAPVQGGIGAWHFMVIGTLLIYLPGVNNIENMTRSFALVVHGAQTAMIIILGSLAIIALPFANKNHIIKDAKIK